MWLNYNFCHIGGGQTVTIVTDPAGTPVDGQPGTFDYPILTSVTLMCMETTSDGSPVTVTSYEWTATNCYTRTGGILNPCFYSLGFATGQNITSNGLLAPDAGTVTCTATIDGVDYTSDQLTLRISGEQLPSLKIYYLLDVHDLIITYQFFCMFNWCNSFNFSSGSSRYYVYS